MQGFRPTCSPAMLMCVDQMRDKDPVGRLVCLYEEEPIAFCGLADAVLQMQQRFDAYGLPQAQTSMHAFTPAKEEVLPMHIQATCQPAWSPDALACCKGERDTFLIEVRFRQHASWQGHVTWLRGKQKVAFRSVLELICLMQQALQTRCLHTRDGQANTPVAEQREFVG